MSKPNLEDVKKLLSEKDQENWNLTEKTADAEFKLINAGFKSFDEAIEILMKCYRFTQKQYFRKCVDIRDITEIFNLEE